MATISNKREGREKLGRMARRTMVSPTLPADKSPLSRIARDPKCELSPDALRNLRIHLVANCAFAIRSVQCATRIA
jgi:hypothetical protein